MNVPKRYLSPKESGWIDGHNKTLANALNDDTGISAQEHKERFSSAPKMLQDTFILQEDGSFLIKRPEESQVMEWHLRDLPIVPGVVLKKLFFHQTQSKAQKITSIQFLWGVFAGQSIIIRKDGIYTPKGQKIVTISIDDAADNIQLPDHNDTITYKEMNEPLDDYLLQQNAFRFVDTGAKEGPIQNNTHFKGEYTIPTDFPRVEENGNISEEIIQEIAAQMGAYVTGPDLNKHIPLIQNSEEKTQLHPESKIFTFKSGKNVSSSLRAHPGETIYIKGRVITFDPNGKEAHFCYTAENKAGYLLLAGESKWNIIPVKMLIRAYNQIKNSAQK